MRTWQPDEAKKLKKDERMFVRWLLRIVGNLIGVYVSYLVYTNILATNIASGVSPNQSSTTALTFAVVVLGAWVGVLEVVVRLGFPDPARRGFRRH